RNARRVRAHVGDEPDGPLLTKLDAFVEPLRDAHRAGGLEPELARRLLLEPRRDEGGRGMAAPLLLLDLRDRPGRTLEAVQDLVDPRAVVEFGRLADLLPVALGESRGEERRRARLEPRLDGPVLLGHEDGDLPLAFDDDAHRHRLYASRGQPAANLVPEQRREPVAHEAV